MASNPLNDPAMIEAMRRDNERMAAGMRAQADLVAQLREEAQPHQAALRRIAELERELSEERMSRDASDEVNEQLIAGANAEAEALRAVLDAEREANAALRARAASLEERWSLAAPLLNYGGRSHLLREAEERHAREQAQLAAALAWQEQARPLVERLLEIAELAQYYAPGELGEFPDMTTQRIAQARALLATEAPGEEPTA